MRLTLRFGAACLAASLYLGPISASAQMAAPKPATAAPAVAPKPGKPALWVVKDPDTTIYLFGTVHLLDGRYDWFRGPVRKAFDESGEIVFEIIPDPAGAGALVQKYALAKDGVPLRQRPGVDAAGLERELKALGANPAAFDAVKPWFGALTLAVLTAQKLGLDPEKGVERTMQAAAAAAGKTLGELETVEYQLQLFDSLPETKQIAFLNLGVSQIARAPEIMDRMVTGWGEGRPEQVAAVLNEGLAGEPDFEKLLLTDRNGRWAKWIEDRLKQPGTVMVAVGGGHLAGANSVQAQLAKDGVRAERVQ